MNPQQVQPGPDSHVGTFDGVGSADNDHPYVFGRRPSSAAPFPFSTHQYVRLLLMRCRLGELALACRTSASDQPLIQVAS
jgi:hypothetical protein